MSQPSPEAEATIVQGLNGLLADAVVLRYKLQSYHWNVRGPHFFDLHEQFEVLYTAWTDHIDAIAERIRAKEATPLPTLSRCVQQSRLAEEEGQPEARTMVERTIADLLTIHAAARDVIDAAESAGDRTSVNLVDDICDEIAKKTWMLRSWHHGAP
ncbi:MAG: DNA starvation/stationary phase protection protein [Planctomycetota bacterium]